MSFQRKLEFCVFSFKVSQVLKKDLEKAYLSAMREITLKVPTTAKSHSIEDATVERFFRDCEVFQGLLLAL